MSAAQPNIVYILGDDHRADYLGFGGHPVLRTPNLDQLAADGVSFTNAFCTSPACTPSRTCHYLGQWERCHGVNFNSNSAVSPDAWDRSFPMVLKRQGYFLGWVGKNHVPVGAGGYGSGHLESVFDYWYGNHGHSGFYPKEQAADGAIYRNARSDTQVEVFEEGVMNFLDPSEDFLSYRGGTDDYSSLERRPPDRPFCLCVTFNLPHGVGTGNMQLRPSDDPLYRDAYRDRQHMLQLPRTYMDFDTAYANPRLPRNVYSGLYIPQYDYVKQPAFLRERQVRTCQTVSGIDRFIGNLRTKLDELQIGDNTIIVFSTDHGLHHGEHGLGGKCFLYEEDIRVPLVIYDPHLPRQLRGRRIDAFVVVPDLAPTVLQLVDAGVPDEMQGRSLAALLKGDETPGDWRSHIFTEQLMDIQNYPRSESVRSDRWKYIRYFARTEDPRQSSRAYRGTLDDYDACLLSTLRGEEPVFEELFDLHNDPHEETNCAMDRSYASVIEQQRVLCTQSGLNVTSRSGVPDTVRLNTG